MLDIKWKLSHIFTITPSVIENKTGGNWGGATMNAKKKCVYRLPSIVCATQPQLFYMVEVFFQFFSHSAPHLESRMSFSQQEVILGGTREYKISG